MVIGSSDLRDPSKEKRTVAKADLSYYRDAAGHVFSVTEADAKKLGYMPVDFENVKADTNAADQAAADARLSEREKALADAEANLKADREAFEKAQADAKAKAK